MFSAIEHFMFTQTVGASNDQRIWARRVLALLVNPQNPKIPCGSIRCIKMSVNNFGNALNCEK